MSRKHYRKPRNKKKSAKEYAQDHIRDVTQMMADPAVAEPKQITRGESMRPATHGGYRHSFQTYSWTLYTKEAAKG